WEGHSHPHGGSLHTRLRRRREPVNAISVGSRVSVPTTEPSISPGNSGEPDVWAEFWRIRLREATSDTWERLRRRGANSDTCPNLRLRSFGFVLADQAVLRQIRVDAPEAVAEVGLP